MTEEKKPKQKTPEQEAIERIEKGMKSMTKTLNSMKAELSDLMEFKNRMVNKYHLSK